MTIIPTPKNRAAFGKVFFLFFICVFTSYRSLQAYIVSIKSDEHTEQAKFQESDCSKEKSKERYKIEAKNSELKHRHGYDVAGVSFFE